MHWIQRIIWRLENLFRKQTVETELDEELQIHLEHEIRDKIKAGMSPQEARRQALISFGGLERYKEQVRDIRGGRSLEDIAQDLRYSIRRLVRSPGFTAIAVLILAMGIGANVAMFSVLEAALVRAFPYSERHQLVMGRATFSGEINPSMSFPDFVDYRSGVDAFASAGLIRALTQQHTMTGGGEPERITGHWVSPEIFKILGVEPQIGRDFSPEAGSTEWVSEVVISHGLWQRRFGGSPDVIGNTTTIDGSPRTVIGVMPPGFRIRSRADIWLAIEPGGLDTDQRDSHSWLMVGRLKPGFNIRAAQAQVDVISRQLRQAYPYSHETKGLLLSRLDDALAEDYRPTLLILMGATALILLVACGNIASLLLARASTRKREFSLRGALGASRRRLVRQLGAESMMLGVLGGASGILMALWFQRLIMRLLPVDALGIHLSGISLPMLFFAVLLSIGTSLLFGIGPAYAVLLKNPIVNLTGGLRASDTGPSARMRNGLVVFQVTISFVLVTVSILFLQSLNRLQSVDIGFSTENLLTADLQISRSRYPETEDRIRFYSELIEEIRTIPGVESASFVNMLPIRHKWLHWGVWIPGHYPASEAEGVGAYSRTVLPGYFKTMGIPITGGRDHQPEDRGSPKQYVVINEALARELFQSGDPLGREIALGSEDEPRLLEVIGVVADSRINYVNQEPGNQMYFQHFMLPYTTMELVVRAKGDPTSLVTPLREVVASHDPDIPLAGVATMTEIIHESLVLDRVTTVMITLFAFAAILLAVTGLYGVLSYIVAKRTHEIGIRMAVGATSRQIMKLVASRGIVLVGGGIVLGAGGALFATRIVRSLLYQAGPPNWFMYVITAGAFLLAGMVASYLPARKAARIDPVESFQRISV